MVIYSYRLIFAASIDVLRVIQVPRSTWLLESILSNAFPLILLAHQVGYFIEVIYKTSIFQRLLQNVPQSLIAHQVVEMSILSLQQFQLDDFQLSLILVSQLRHVFFFLRFFTLIRFCFYGTQVCFHACLLPFLHPDLSILFGDLLLVHYSLLLLLFFQYLIHQNQNRFTLTQVEDFQFILFVLSLIIDFPQAVVPKK